MEALVCIKGDGGRLARFAIKRFWLFESDLSVEDFSAGMNALWREKHQKASIIPKRPARYKIAAPEGMKHCNGCERDRVHAEFSVDRSRPDGLNNRCRECAAKNWKRMQGQLCKKCGGECVGQICHRCYTIAIRVREAEWDALSLIPSLVYEAQRPLRDFMRDLAEMTNVTPQKRLKMLLERIAA